MHDQHSKLHAELARQIRLAKKRMFKRHREGGRIASVGTQFLSEVSNVLSLLNDADLNRETPQAETISEVLGHSPVQPSRYTHVTEPRETPTRLRENLASAISELLSNDLCPPRLRNAVINFVTDAPEQEKGGAR
jgi:hypothetical protein